MITDIQSKRMVVISDLHLGNPFSKARMAVIEFIRWAADNKYDLCINGDGFEIAQVSFQKLAYDVPDVLRALKLVTEKGQQVYYVIGNHDIALENFLDDWGTLKLAPFLNIKSKQSRFRVEHGHLYDPFFVRFPRLYEWVTHFVGFLLMISPNVYKLWIAFEKMLSDMRKKNNLVNPFLKLGESGIAGEHPNFVSAANEVCHRGFDAVVFGHTHHAGQASVTAGGTYFNSGSWLVKPSYVEINDGSIQLKTWKNPRAK